MSTNSTKVTLQSKLTAVSSKPVGSGKTHTLTGLDHAMGFHTLHMIFYYKDEDNLFGDSFDLDPVRESLSKVLTMYPTMTGRLARGQDGNWEVKCNDAGVRVIKATVDSPLDQWLTSATASQEAHLVAWEDMPHDPTTWSPFQIQINSFEGGGVAIGVSCNHMLADPTSVASFFKSWTQAHRNVPITNPPSLGPLNDDASPIPNGDDAISSPTKSQTLLTCSASTKNMATFKFSNSVIQKCLSEFHDTCPDATPFDFLSALFWTRIAAQKDHDRSHSLSICADFRRILLKSAPLPLGYFGNALHFSTLSRNVRDKDTLGIVVGEVHRHVAGIKAEEIRSFTERFESKEYSEGMYGSHLLTSVCMEHMFEEGADDDVSLLYGAMFSNEERPVHVSCHVGNVGAEGLIMVMPSPEGGLARIVTVMLPEEELVAELSKDQAILHLEPTLLLADAGGNALL